MQVMTVTTPAINDTQYHIGIQILINDRQAFYVNTDDAALAAECAKVPDLIYRAYLAGMAGEQFELRRS